MKTSILTLALLASTQMFAQVADTDNSKTTYETVQEFFPIASGTLFSDVRYVEAQGTAYFDQQWVNSTVITTSGKAYKEVPVRIDLLGNKVHYKADDGREMVIGAPLKEVQQEANGKTIRFVNGNLLPNKRNGWFQVLVNDSVSLVKSFSKFFEEKPSYGGNLLYIKTTENYLVYAGGDEFAIKKITDLVDVLPASKVEIEAEIKRLKSSSKEGQLIGVTNFINTLIRK